jgi:hypothetical protein
MTAADAQCNAERPPQGGTDPVQVFEQHSRHLSIQCQPVASRGDNDIMWPATVRHLSAETIQLVLQRRFEPRTGLSLFLPDPGSDSSYNVFVRVGRVESLDQGRWLLDCAFLTPLTEERLEILLDLVNRAPLTAPGPDTETGLGHHTVVDREVIQGVVFQVRHGNREPIRRSVTRLYIHCRWPVRTGQAMKIWLGSGPTNESAANIRVNGCYKQDGRWLLDCYFLGAPPATLLEKLNSRKERRDARAGRPSSAWAGA